MKKILAILVVFLFAISCSNPVTTEALSTDQPPTAVIAPHPVISGYQGYAICTVDSGKYLNVYQNHTTKSKLFGGKTHLTHNEIIYVTGTAAYNGVLYAKFNYSCYCNSSTLTSHTLYAAAKYLDKAN